MLDSSRACRNASGGRVMSTILTMNGERENLVFFAILNQQVSVRIVQLGLAKPKQEVVEC